MCPGESELSSAPRDLKPIRPANSSLGRATSSPRSFSFFFPSLPTYSFLLDPTVKLASDNSKVSSLLTPRGISFPPDVDTGPHRLSPSMTSKQGRRRRSSSLIYQEPAESIEHTSDQAALPNLNANWVNAKGAWTIHFVCIAALKIFYDIIPGVSQETSWTLTNISYMFGSFLMFHWVRGIPFEFNAGAYDNLNMWEQIDNGDQYTPAKKFLLCVPIVLFLLSTHYTHFDLTHFTINFLATLGVVIPKLPFSHRLRIGLFSDIPEES